MTFSIVANSGPDRLECESLEHLHRDPLWTPCRVGLYRGDEGNLIGRSAPRFTGTSCLLAAEIGIVDLDPSVECLPLVTLDQHAHQLVLEKPGGVALHAEAAGELERADAVLGLGKVVDPEKPQPQRELGTVKDGAGGDRGLMAARGALVEPRTRGQPMGSAVPAARTDETIGPAQRLERGEALCLATVVLVEGRFTETFLELDGVACHDGCLVRG